MALTIGEKMGLFSWELAQLRLGASLHDIGKQYIPREILEKKAPLTSEEWELIQMHPILGWQHVETTNLDDSVKRIILGHHLWANGEGGYPNSSQSFKPCLLTQITTVADVADAMTSDRPYRRALTVEKCFEYLEENSGDKFNSDVIDAFRVIVREQSIG